MIRLIRSRPWLALTPLLVFLAALPGCSRAPRSPEVTASAVSRGPADTVEASPGRPSTQVAGSRAGGEASIVALPRAIQLVPGFRVELLRTPSLRDAEGLRDRISDVLNELTYVEYENPFYRVRAGDFPTREAAEAWRQEVAAPQFERTEVVRTLIVSR